MKIPPLYKITREIHAVLRKIESHKHFFISLFIPPGVKKKLQRLSLLKSSLFSARIEGNPLTIETFDSTPATQKKIEVSNIMSAVKYIESKIKVGKPITEKSILVLHTIVMKNLAVETGFFRKEMSAIFNKAGNAVYLPPNPTQINALISQLFVYINKNEEKSPLIQALLAHLIFEKIHPFLDGNGRVGRLLIQAVLKARGYDFSLFIPCEEYLDEHKGDYYHYLDIGMKDTNAYLRFMLDGFFTQLEKVKNVLTQELEKKEEILLLPPRQEEMYRIIKDHRVVSFDFLRRRFLKVPARTLRYDLKKLVKNEYVVKIGKTKGSYYKVKVEF